MASMKIDSFYKETMDAMIWSMMCRRVDISNLGRNKYPKSPIMIGGVDMISDESRQWRIITSDRMKIAPDRLNKTRWVERHDAASAKYLRAAHTVLRLNLDNKFPLNKMVLRSEFWTAGEVVYGEELIKDVVACAKFNKEVMEDVLDRWWKVYDYYKPIVERDDTVWHVPPEISGFFSDFQTLFNEKLLPSVDLLKERDNLEEWGAW